MTSYKKDWFTIVIANYNGEDYLPKCLTSILKSTYSKYQIVIVDDHSSDRSVEIINRYRKDYQNITLIRNKTNIGPSGSRNRALEVISTEFVYFIDNDTEVKKNWLQEVYRCFSADQKTGAVQSLLCDFDNRHIIQNAGLKLIPQTGWAIGLNESQDLKSVHKFPSEVVGLSAALAVRKVVFDQGVTFDKHFYHYSEDLDFSWRMWIAGFKIKLASTSVVYHKVKKIDERRNVGANMQIVYFHLAKNSLRSLTKNYQLLNLLFYFPQCIAILIIRAFLVLLLRKDPSSLIGTLKAFWWFVLHIQNTLDERAKVQRVLRKVPDSAFLKTIMVQYSLFDIYRKHFKQTKLLPIS